jgi:hypothetical protein
MEASEEEKSDAGEDEEEVSESEKVGWSHVLSQICLSTSLSIMLPCNIPPQPPAPAACCFFPSAPANDPGYSPVMRDLPCVTIFVIISFV